MKLAAVLWLAAAGCGVADFDVDQPVQEQMIQGSPIPGPLQVLFPIPLNVDISAQMLKDEPGFDKDHWPSMADPTWGESLHTYYNRDPYWNSRRDYVDPDVPPTAH